MNGERSELQRFGDVFGFEIRVLGESLVAGHPVSDHRNNGGDREPQATDARDATRAAVTVGYASPSSFVAAFRAELGTPPREFMKR